MKRKCLSVGIILLFIGVAIAPSINFNVVKASNDNDLVEVTSQACGIQGFGNTTVKLTREQYFDLEKLLNDTQYRLKNVQTKDETILIFNKLSTNLKKYGLLARGLNIVDDKQLRMEKVPEFTYMMKNFVKRHYISNTRSNVDNYLCLVAGKINHGIISFNVLSRCAIAFLILTLAFFPLYIVYHENVPNEVYRVIENIFNLWCHHIVRRPIHILDTMTVGPGYNGYDQIGPLFSVGLLGIKYNPAATNFNIYGYSGIIISSDILKSDCYLFGTALSIQYYGYPNR